jgi:hypothetical protein
LKIKFVFPAHHPYKLLFITAYLNGILQFWPIGK